MSASKYFKESDIPANVHFGGQIMFTKQNMIDFAESYADQETREVVEANKELLDALDNILKRYSPFSLHEANKVFKKHSK